MYSFTNNLRQDPWKLGNTRKRPNPTKCQPSTRPPRQTKSPANTIRKPLKNRNLNLKRLPKRTLCHWISKRPKRFYATQFALPQKCHQNILARPMPPAPPTHPPPQTWKKTLIPLSPGGPQKGTGGMKLLKRLITFHEALQTRPYKNDLPRSRCNPPSSNT